MIYLVIDMGSNTYTEPKMSVKKNISKLNANMCKP